MKKPPGPTRDHTCPSYYRRNWEDNLEEEFEIIQTIDTGTISYPERKKRKLKNTWLPVASEKEAAPFEEQEVAELGDLWIEKYNRAFGGGPLPL